MRGLVKRRGGGWRKRGGGREGVVNANRKAPPYVGVLNIICIVEETDGSEARIDNSLSRLRGEGREGWGRQDKERKRV